VKKPLRSNHKLAIRKETVRTLNRLELIGVGGGEPTTTVTPTHIACSTLPACPPTTTTL
jgi:hypothetical protein